MAQRILVIDDDPQVVELVSLQLTKHGYEVQAAETAESGLDLLSQWQPDLALVDIVLPGTDGWTAAAQIHQAGIPIIFLTGMTEEQYVVRGLNLGADDFLAKPFRPDELLARIRTVLRRTGALPKDSAIYTNGPLTINRDTHEVWLNNTPIKLTRREFRLLAALAANEGKVVPHEKLLVLAWGPHHTAQPALKLYILYLRRKIETDPHKPVLILTVRGIGYRLVKVSKSRE